LSWKSGITMGYVAIELIFNYCIHVFFVFSCFSLLADINKKYKVLLFILLIALFSISFFFAFGIIEFMVIAVVFGYCFLFYVIFTRLQTNNPIELRFKRLNVIGVFITLIWLFLDVFLFN